MKGRQKQHSIFLEMGKNLSNTKPYIKKDTHSFFSNKPKFNNTVLPNTAPYISSTKTSNQARRKASLPLNNKKYPTSVTIGMND